MQPNQPLAPTPNQDPQPVTPIQPTPSSPYEQPQPVQESEFKQGYEPTLHAPAPKKSRKGLIIGAIIGSVLLIAAAAGAYAWIQHTNSPQQRLYRALENHMRTSYVQQERQQDITLATTANTAIQSISDFSDPKTPKSYLEYVQKINGKDKVNLSGKLISLNDKEYYANLTKTLSFSGKDSDLAPVTDQWYQVDADESFGSIFFDPLGTMSATNTSKGEFLVGNFKEDVRKDLMTFIKERNVYTIKTSEEVTVDSETMTKYTLAIDLDRVNELNDKATEALSLPKGTKVNDVKQGDGQTNQLWVSHTSGRIVKTELTHDSRGTKTNGSKATDTNTITFSYPSDASKITKPDTSISVPWK